MTRTTVSVAMAWLTQINNYQIITLKPKKMKLVTAVIRETQLEAVRTALIEADVTRITISSVSGHGRQKREQIYRGRRVIPSLIPKIKIEVAVNEEFVQTTIDAIIKGARTKDNGDDGTIGDGKIFITPLEETIRIRTGEKGNSAI